MSPAVSVVITTRERPQLVLRAVKSVLAQTFKDLELIVVMDGPDTETRDCIASVAGPLVRIEVRDPPGGQAAAINAGVALASGRWTALLDDDDEWMPEKLATQLDAAAASAAARPVIGCRLVARSTAGDLVWPRRAPRDGEPIAEYLFCRSEFAFGEGMLQTSTLFAPTELFREVPMDENWPRHCDLGWILRASGRPGVRVGLPADPRPLSVWNLEGSDRMSKAHDWRGSRAWILARRALVGPRACAGFLLNWAGYSARCQRDYSAIPTLLADAFRSGRPGAMDLAAFAALWCLPFATRARWSRSLARRMRPVPIP